MNKKQIKKALEPARPGEEWVKVWLEHASDAKSASIKFESNKPMTAMDLIHAACEFVNDMAETAYFQAKKDVPPSVIPEGEH